MVALIMLDVFADDLSDFVFSVSPLFSFPAVPPTGSAPSSGGPSDSAGDDSSGEDSSGFTDEAIDEAASVSEALIDVEAVEVTGTKSLVGSIVVVVGIAVTTFVEVLNSMSIFH